MKYDNRLSIRVEKDDRKYLKEEAKKNKLTISGLIRYWIGYFRKKQK